VTAPHLLAVNLLSAHSLLASFGAIGVFLIMFAETGLLVGIFLPGDSLLFTAGLLCSTKVHDSVHLSLPAILVAAAAGALLGAQTGYLIGRKAGPPLLERRQRLRLRRTVGQTRDYLERYGHTKAVVIGRFIPFVRTVINPVAGVVNMPQRQFATAQVAGGLVWTAGVTLAGYALGSRIPSIDKYLLPIVAAVVIVSLIPIALEIRRARREDPNTR
jgi:membrane-associated protein